VRRGKIPRASLLWPLAGHALATTLGHPGALTRVACRRQNLTRVEATPRFRKGIDSLRDREGRARILVRIDRLAHGHPGQHRNLTGGISELKIDAGPGYRVYYLQRGSTVLLLLAGGDKSTQDKDIAVATRLARDYGR
jgi:putative addiction module killer protein